MTHPKMLPTASLAIVLSAVGLVVAGACDGGGGGSVATSGSGGEAGNATGAGGLPPLPDAGQGGRGGAPGADPLWEPFAETVAGCELSHVANASEVRAFSWEPCAGTAGCQRMVLHRAWAVPYAPLDLFHGHVRTTDHGDIVGLRLWFGPAVAGELLLFATADGQLLDAYRVMRGQGEGCVGDLPTIGPDRYRMVVHWGSLPGPRRLGGILHALDGSEPPTVFEVPTLPTGIGPQIYTALGRDRWIWQFYVDKFLSVSAADGSGLYPIAERSDGGPILLLNIVTSDDDLFLFHQVNALDPMTVQGTIAMSNGLEPSAPYLVPTDDSYYGAPAYAHSHIGWFRGYGQTGVNSFDRVEVWASPYRTNPADLAPYKVADHVIPHVATWVVGGHGYMAAAGDTFSHEARRKVSIWDLANRGEHFRQLPGDHEIYRLLGFSTTHVYVSARATQDSIVDMIVRFEVP